MKYYKLKNSRVIDARNSQPLDCYYADGTFSFYVSESGEILQDPFVEIQKEDLPQEFIDAFDEMVKSYKAGLMVKAQEIVDGIVEFKSSAIGEELIYDLAQQDQINLAQAREYLKSGNSESKVGIRATKVSTGIKDNYMHTGDQISQVFDEWYVYKSKILDAFSTMKIELAQATTKLEASDAYQKFQSTIKES